MRTIKSVQTTGDSLIVFSERVNNDGSLAEEIHHGHWVQKGHPLVDIPKFMWRRLPEIPLDCHEFDPAVELTAKEREILRVRVLEIEKAAKK